MQRENGTIKNYFDQRGFGFIQREGAPDLFFHVKDCNIEAETVLQPGAAVTFDVNSKGDRPRGVCVELA